MKQQENNFKIPCEKITNSVEETEQFANFFAQFVKRGDCLAFLGQMGAGKTAFIRGLVSGLGILKDVSSPTFAIVNEYHGKYTVIHFDMYRICGEDDLETTGFYEYLNNKNIIAIEWSENILNFLPKDAIKIKLEYIDENKRKIKISREMIL